MLQSKNIKLKLLVKQLASCCLFLVMRIISKIEIIIYYDLRDTTTTST